MASDVKQGWHCVLASDGSFNQCGYVWHGELITGTTPLPPDWTLGPSIADLLRDAERYRWLRSHRAAAREVWWWQVDEPTVDAVIDREIARERQP